MSIGVGLCLPQLGEHVTPDTVRQFCLRAEELGYSSLWVQDHFMWPLNPVRGYAGRAGAPVPKQYQSVLAPTELLTAAACWTSRVRLGTSILVAGNHWPVPLAQRLSTIDVLSGGRLLVGIGVGWNAEEHDASGTDIRTRGARMDDFVDALKACWRDDPVEHEGPFFTIPPSIIRPKPVQRPRPLLLSGMWSTAGLERTRQHFDAWNPAGLSVAAASAAAEAMNADRPVGMAPLQVFHRAFAQFPHAPTPTGDVVTRLAAEAVEAQNAGFTEFVMEHNFWDGVRSPDDWAALPDRFAPVLAAVRQSPTL
jgi:probable F420-dependent oxidoreductase